MFKDMATRIVNAEENFISFVMDSIKCNYDTGEKVLNLYKKERLLKIDPVIGQWNIKHGAFLDKKVLYRAAKI